MRVGKTISTPSLGQTRSYFARSAELRRLDDHLQVERVTRRGGNRLPDVVANGGAERDRGYAQPSCLTLIPSFQIFVM